MNSCQDNCFPWLKNKAQEEGLDNKLEEFGPLWEAKYTIAYIPKWRFHLQI
jgi:hypothetical protein